MSEHPTCPFCGVVEPCRAHVVAPAGLPAMSAPGADPLAAIRQRAEQATPGPWKACEEQTPSGELTVMGGERGRLYVANTVDGLLEGEEAANAAFIAHAREDIPFLLKQWDTHQSALRALVADMQDRIDYMHRDTDWYRAQELEYWKRKVERLLSGPQP